MLFLLVVGFTTAEFAWWVVFNIRQSTEQLELLRQRTERDRLLASEMLMMQAQLPSATSQSSEALLTRHFPYLEWRGGGTAGSSHGVAVRQSVLGNMEEKHSARVRMFLWEGGFFLATLMVGVALILRTMRREVNLRRQQANFLSAVTHELKSPLASIRLYTETMQLRDPPAERRERYLRNIRQDVDRLETLVGNVLAVSRLEAHRFVSEPERGDLAADVESIVAPFVQELRERGGECELELPEGSLVAHYDASSLRTVLRNLLDNAVKYGGDSKRVQVRLKERSGWAELEVADQGIGLPRSELQRIFEKFYRVGDELVRQAEGSGLGLYLVRELVRQGGGEVVADSAGVGKGTTFLVRLPMDAKAGGRASDVRAAPGELLGGRPEDA